jgi:two-component system, OmpR family, heavy metal sensor histidine kinase CusS
MKKYTKTLLAIALVFISYTLILVGYIYFSFSKYAFDDFYKRLELRVSTLANIEFASEDEANSLVNTYTKYLEQLPNQKHTIVPLNQVVTNKKLPEKLPENFIDNVLNYSKYSDNLDEIFYSAMIYKNAEGKSYLVIASAENYFYSHHIKYLQNLLLTSIIFSLVLTFIISHFILKSIIKPVKNIIDDVNKIDSDNLHFRLPEPNAKDTDTISELAITFNNMLSRIETVFETQKNFISNASHELNTPLTSIIGEADLCLSKQRSIPEYEKALKSILLEAEKLEQKTKALLLLARTGFDGKTQKFVKVRIDEVLMNVQQNLMNVNKDFKIKIDFSLLPENPESLKVKGNEQLLLLAISNIVSNACKYSNNNDVYIGLGATKTSVIITIKDRGIGIPVDEISKVFDLYFRASNTYVFEGYGIGLPLSNNIIKMHNGVVNIKSVEGKGTTVQITLPIFSIKN